MGKSLKHWLWLALVIVIVCIGFYPKAAFADSKDILGNGPAVLTNPYGRSHTSLNGIQDYWNRKGLVSEKGEKKKAFYVLQEHYQSMGE